MATTPPRRGLGHRTRRYSVAHPPNLARTAHPGCKMTTSGPLRPAPRASPTVHVQDELRELAMLVGLVDPLAGQIHQVLEVLLGGECFRLEAGHFAGGSGLTVFALTADHDRHRVAVDILTSRDRKGARP